MLKIFYYDQESENLLEESDAEEASVEEFIEELYELNDDNTSYIGLMTEKESYKIKSDDYDSYIIYKFDDSLDEYVMSDLGDFEKCKSFLISQFPERPHTSEEKVERSRENKWLPPDWNKN